MTVPVKQHDQAARRKTEIQDPPAGNWRALADVELHQTLVATTASTGLMLSQDVSSPPENKMNVSGSVQVTP